MRMFMLAAALVLVGCAAPRQASLEDMDAALEKNQAAAERLYPGKSISEVRKAAQRVLFLVDQSDMTFDVRDNELLASRYSTFYAVFYVGFGRDWYSVDFTQTAEGTRSRFGFSGQMNSGMFASPIFVSYQSKISVSALQNPADFKLFHDRVEYVLGIRPDWITCEQAKAAQTDPRREMALCDSIGIEDRSPVP